MLSFKRGKRRVSADYKSNDIYDFYLKKSKNPLPKDIFWTIFKSVIYGKKNLYKGLIDMIIYDNAYIRLPGKLGGIQIKKTKRYAVPSKIGRYKLPIDYKASKELWEQQYVGLSSEEIQKIPGKKVIYNLNEHTNRYSCRFFWNKITSNTKNQSFYTLGLNREHKQSLKNALFNNKNLINTYYE